MQSSPTTLPDRRPIAARQRPIFHHLATTLARRGITPNTISIAGLLVAFAAAACLAVTAFQPPPIARLLWLSAAILIQCRLLANMLDGMVAIAAERTSALGEVYNEVPDRIADAAILIGLGYAMGSAPELGYIAAILAILTAYIRSLGKSLGLASDFRGPMAKQHRMFIITVTAAYLAIAPGAWHPAIVFAGESVAASWGLPTLALLIIILGCIITFARRLAGIAAALKAGVTQ